jgi:endonuclease/exonuclease/phosphatase family metal-dependent hydrolase
LWKNKQMRVATWNIKQAVAPKKPLPHLWQWMEDSIDADIVVLTEAKVPNEGVPTGWSAVWKPDGIGSRRRWGTVIAARDGYELVDVTNGAKDRGGFSVTHPWPGAVTIVDVMNDGEYLATVVGIYAITLDMDGNSIGSGAVSVPAILASLEKLYLSERGEKLVIAGDFNLWPFHMPNFLYENFIDVVSGTADLREPLTGCSGCDVAPEECGHMWTHKNGNSPNAAVQNLDYIFISEHFEANVIDVFGGVADFPDAWDVSDHAPLVLELEF